MMRRGEILYTQCTIAQRWAVECFIKLESPNWTKHCDETPSNMIKTIKLIVPINFDLCGDWMCLISFLEAHRSFGSVVIVRNDLLFAALFNFDFEIFMIMPVTIMNSQYTIVLCPFSHSAPLCVRFRGTTESSDEWSFGMQENELSSYL